MRLGLVSFLSSLTDGLSGFPYWLILGGTTYGTTINFNWQTARKQRDVVLIPHYTYFGGLLTDSTKQQNVVLMPPCSSPHLTFNPYQPRRNLPAATRFSSRQASNFALASDFHLDLFCKRLLLLSINEVFG